MKELACRDEQFTVNALVDLMIRLDRLHWTNHPVQWGPLLPKPGAAEEPMRLGQARLREEEREGRRRESRCF